MVPNNSGPANLGSPPVSELAPTCCRPWGVLTFNRSMPDAGILALVTNKLNRGHPDATPS